jgi:hypothetical protein
MMHGPDDGHVLDRDQHPTKQDDFLRARVRRHGTPHMHFLDEGVAEVVRVAAAKKVEEVGEHPEKKIPRLVEKESVRLWLNFQRSTLNVQRPKRTKEGGFGR